MRPSMLDYNAAEADTRPDLVKRLQQEARAWDYDQCPQVAGLLKEAAGEITRLRREAEARKAVEA